jgi:hypothetical protein
MRVLVNLVNRWILLGCGLALVAGLIWIVARRPELGAAKPAGGSSATRPEGTPGTFTYTDSNGEVTTVEMGFAPGESPAPSTTK